MTRRRLGLLLLAGAVIVSCQSQDPTIGNLTKFLREDGLTICSSTLDRDGYANQAIDTRVVVVANSCESDAVTLVVDRFTEDDDRDAAARNLAGQVGPRGDGVVWVWGSFTISVSGPRDDGVMDQITETLDSVGAV